MDRLAAWNVRGVCGYINNALETVSANFISLTEAKRDCDQSKVELSTNWTTNILPICRDIPSSSEADSNRKLEGMVLDKTK